MLGNEHIGERVAVRIRLPGDTPGRRFTDILGQLIQVTDGELVIDRDGETVTVQRADMVSGKPIPPKPEPRRPRRPKGP